MTLWLVGQVRSHDGAGKTVCWEFQGLFDTEEKAVAACRSPWYWIVPVVLNEERPDETTPGWEGSYYPVAQVSPEDWGSRLEQEKPGAE